MVRDSRLVRVSQPGKRRKKLSGRKKFSTVMEIDENSEFIVVDLGDLSSTSIGKAILGAELDVSSGQPSVRIRSEFVDKRLHCKPIDVAGTYVIYSEPGKTVGSTTNVLRVFNEVD